ncbi:acetyl-CoA carboxylase biotin carboxylase subunit [Streptomyces meridianus]|uniref:Carbamoyl phosphate synthase n=1 Tax=Streptomyces meridianus TaxID=2938945 RepID=A0ABT0XB16_9ACTN|nr:biotin carboxylase N-terminal domain-containing protein [Streptomyces meridianus]MCM2579495.1 carbamoyl phosphate synthase [Streptomyces meridianus]
MFDTVLVANRGEIARRILRTARRLGIRGVAVYSDADASMPFVTEADTAVHLGGSAHAESYRNIDKVIAAARESGAQAVHPGYGFLSENAEFARAVQDAGLIWIGPDPEVIDLMGDKINARNVMERAGVPVGKGTGDPVTDVEAAVKAAAAIGYPVMIKASAGGGGMGMTAVHGEEELRKQFDAIQGFAERTFGDASILLERFFPQARHVEVQILGLADGRVVALGERDCSVQRRNQKVAEETPSPGVGEELRQRMLEAAVRAGEAVGYRNAGTVECLVSGDEFVFLEMNTRLQVEHPVTEAVFGIDLVEEQFRVAAGEPVTFDPDTLTATGHALELRINAEDPKRFLPGPGAITQWREPTGEGVRVDSGYAAGTKVTPFYDSLMAKLVVHAPTREEALARARSAVAEFEVQGPKSNLAFFTELLDHEEFVSGRYDTGLVARMRRPSAP